MDPIVKPALKKGGKWRRVTALLAGVLMLGLVPLAGQAVAPQSSLLAPTAARADGFGHEARIKNDKQSVRSIRACRDRISDAKCHGTSASHPRMTLKPGESTPFRQDWDGFWCPANSVCSVRWPGGVWYEWYESSAFASKFVAVGGCAGCTKVVRVYSKAHGGGGGGGW